MNKRRASLSDLQMVFSFDVPALANDDGDLAGFGAMVSASVGRVLREDTRSREAIAKAMSRLLGEDVSRWMLDSWSAESRDGNNIPAHRWWALIAATGRFDVADAIATRVGARLLSGDEIKAAELGHLKVEQAAIAARIKELTAEARPIKRGRR